MIRSLDADSVEAALKRDDLPADVRRVLEIRSLVGSASVKKLYAIENQTSGDDRLRGLIIHHGARTGRPTGSGPQPLNLPKAGPQLVTCEPCGQPYTPKLTACPWCFAPAVPGARTAWHAGMVDPVLQIMATRSLEAVEYFFGDAVLSIMGCVRGLFQAGPGKELIASDYSAIEAVVAACVAGEQWRIETFKERKDIYLMGASAITGTMYEEYKRYGEEHDKHHPDRQNIGKVAELACFGPRTQVLTPRGYVAMEEVLSTDKVWDGVEWVKHQGIVARGVKPCLLLDGVTITPDHLVNCNGSWKEAETLVSNPEQMRLSLETGSENLPSSGRTVGNEKPSLLCFARAAKALTTCLPRISLKAHPPAAQNAPARSPQSTEKTFGGTRTLFQIRNTAGVFLTEFRRVLLDAVRGTLPKGQRTTRPEESECMNRGATEPKGVGLFSAIWWGLKGGTFQLLKWIGSTRMGTMNRETFGSYRGPRTWQTSDPSPRCNPVSTHLSPVYDIVNAGVRNRFTIKTDSGHLLVHNCGFGGWIGAWRAFDPDEANKSDQYLKDIILKWRDASPNIVEMWGGQRPLRFGIEGAAINAIEAPGHVFTPKRRNGTEFPVRLEFFVAPFGNTGRNALFIRLPSGRLLTYHRPMASPSANRPGTQMVSYWTENTNPKYGGLGWTCMETWGSRIFENVVQAIAHDIQRHGIELCKAAGYPMVLGVYDEDVFEVPEGFGSIEEVESLMATMPAWAQGWPIRAADGWRGKRYRK